MSCTVRHLSDDSLEFASKSDLFRMVQRVLSQSAAFLSMDEASCLRQVLSVIRLHSPKYDSYPRIRPC